MHILAVLLLSFGAHAEMAPLFGFGPVSQGMGGTPMVEGKPSAYNVSSAPATLGFIHQVEVSAGAMYFKPDLKPYGTLVLNSSGTTGVFNSAGVLEGGGSILALALPLGKIRPLTIGAAFYLPMGTLIRVSGTPIDHPFYPLYTDISKNLFYSIGAGYEIWDGWAIGFNVRSTTKSVAYYELRSDNQVNYSSSAVEARGQSRVSISLVYDNGRKNPDSAWSLGAMYRAKAGLETKLSANISAFVPVQGALNSTPAYSPSEWVVMGTAKLFTQTIISAELAYVKWSQYISPYGSGNINTLVVGGNHKDANFKDVLVPRVGVEQTFPLSGGFLRRIIARGGYMLYRSPVPDQTDDSNFVDNTRHDFTAGMGLGFPDPFDAGKILDLDFFFQYNWLKNRTITKNSATNVGAPGYTAGGKIYLLGMAATVRF